MNSAPIINAVGNATSTSAPKVANGQQSDTSFGQVLAQQGNANSASPQATSGTQNSGTQNPGSANAGAPQTAATPGTTSSGKPGKAKSAHDQTTDSSGNTAANTTSNAADPGTVNGSAQLLALVSNVQQASTTDATTTAAGANAALAAMSSNANVSSAQAALANFQASVTDQASSSTDANTALAKLPTPTASMKESLPTTALDGKTNIAATDSNADSQSTAAVNADSKSLLQQPALDLAAAAEKNIAAGLADIDAAAAKSASAIQSAAALTAAAIPAVQNVVQTAGLAVAQAVGTTDKLTPQVGSAGWDQALGQKVVWMVAGGQQSASLTLNPPDLGPMQVVLNVTNSHATATFTAAQPEVRQALEAAMPKLREMLGDAGISLGQTSVNAGSAQQQQNFAEQNAQKSSGSVQAVDPVETRVAASLPRPTSSGIGLVDTFA